MTIHSRAWPCRAGTGVAFAATGPGGHSAPCRPPAPARPPAHPEEPAAVSPFDRIVIVFNPNSTGDAPASAEQLRAELARRLPTVPLELRPTRYAGHAREI